jgi:hypothetical protein
LVDFLLFHLYFQICYKFPGKLLFCAMVFIAFHSICCLSIVSGSVCILLIWYRYAAILCSVGWLDR